MEERGEEAKPGKRGERKRLTKKKEEGENNIKRNESEYTRR